MMSPRASLRSSSVRCAAGASVNVIHVIAAAAATPTVSAVKVTKGKLTVDGADFELNGAVVEVDGAAYGQLKYPKAFRENGVARRIVSKDARVRSLQVGVTYQITILNPTSGVRSAPFAFTR